HREIKREGIPFSAKPVTCRLRRRRSCPRELLQPHAENRPLRSTGFSCRRRRRFCCLSPSPACSTSDWRRSWCQGPDLMRLDT
uniref:Uncharacterized protein n=1 Tax=Aegilops tauschii subsp. strangulata TaxID=200361 RepID=A0A453CT34_AEGTS